MHIEIKDEIAENTGFNEQEMLEFLAISLYKKKLINGVQGGKLLRISEMEFHRLLQKFDEYVNYSEEDLNEDLDSLTDLE